MPYKKISVLGDGAWGTAFCFLLIENGHDVRQLSHDPTYVFEMKVRDENFKFLPGRHLPKKLEILADTRDALDGAELVVCATPTPYLRSFLNARKNDFPKDIPWLSLTKGIENKTHMRPSEVIQDVLGKEIKVAALSGPSLAEEVVSRKPAAVVVAHEDEVFTKRLQKTLMNPFFRVYRNPDIAGVELSGALKNVIAIAAGVSDGLGFGDNTKAALLTRGIHEILKLGLKLGAHAETFYGLAGFGDLVTTSFSPLGRNHYVGMHLGKGFTLDEILRTIKGVPEGVYTAQAVHEWRQKLGVEMPISEAVYRVVFEKLHPKEAVLSLMSREGKSESGQP